MLGCELDFPEMDFIAVSGRREYFRVILILILMVCICICICIHTHINTSFRLFILRSMRLGFGIVVGIHVYFREERDSVKRSRFSVSLGSIVPQNLRRFNLHYD